MRYDSKRTQEETRKDFFASYRKTAEMYPQTSPKEFKEKLLSPTKPTPHPIHNTIQKIRGNFLRLGFKEIENPLFIEEQDVYKQYGPEAPAILDRCYYLAGLPRPDIGLSDTKIKELGKITPVNPEKTEKLKAVLRDYKLGRIEGDDLLDSISKNLSINPEDATKILDSFPELKNIKAEPTKTTLRSHMTAAWFPTLQALQDREDTPIKLFSIGLRFRREQKIDATHLRAHYGASCVIADEEMSLDAGKEIVAEILKPLGFKDFDFVQKETTSTYYADKSEYEVYASAPGKTDKIEVADIGMYSPLALANYDITYPTFNAGFGIERILMILEKKQDVREVFFPQFYTQLDLTDEEIMKEIAIREKPKTNEGKNLSKRIEETAEKYANEPSPCSYDVFKGKFLGRGIEVRILEKESNTKLLGPAAMNEVYVYQGGIFGIPKDERLLKERMLEIRQKGKSAGIYYLTAISDYFASNIEKAVERGEGYADQIKMAKTALDVNIAVGERAARFIQSKEKQINLKGPIFTAVEAKLV
ncbi:MAG: O-phosphoserine--tRNA ligase [Candidatus Altiarchaeota archaeon]|nr:O-phosphoserine--tRNA ligase [Candidatus Altiarchaeota archaeon]